MPMQIRLTVLGPRSGGQGARAGSETGTTAGPPHPAADGPTVAGQPTGTALGEIGGRPAAACDVLVTAPEGTVLAAVSHALVSCAAACGVGPGPGGTAEAVAVYAGGRRLDVHQQRLGEPPLLDGAVVSLTGPAEITVPPSLDGALALLRVVAGPDAGGVHLLRGGEVRVGRSTEAEVRLDDPDVSRLHCVVRVDGSGQLAVADLGSTNGTTVDGVPVTGHPLALRPGSTLRLGESALRVETAPTGQARDTLAHSPHRDRPRTVPDGLGRLTLAPRGEADRPAPRNARPAPGGDAPGRVEPAVPTPRRPAHPADPPPSGPTGEVTGELAGAAERLPGQRAGAPKDVEHGRARGLGSPPGGAHPSGTAQPPGDAVTSGETRPSAETRRVRGIGAWARRFAGRPTGGPEEAAGPSTGPDTGPPASSPSDSVAGDHPWPDPSTVLLTALGPGPRLWERGPDHPEALTVRLGTVWGPGGTARPLTVGLGALGSLGLAGPRPRLAGLARSVLAQLTALHGPRTLHLVILAADPARPVAERSAEWSWAGWLPHSLPTRGQECRLRLAFDARQATARLTELARLVDTGPLGPDWAATDPTALHAVTAELRVRQGGDAPPGPAVLVVVDGDPGTEELRAQVAQLAVYGPVVGVHLLCLAETPAASPASPTASTLRAARAASPGFPWCGAAALLSGAVATAVRVLRPDGREAVTGTVAAVDAVSRAWAERFARALAPLRQDDAAAVPRETGHVTGVPPASCRLLEELGLARATPTALLARWAAEERNDVTGYGPGRASAVLGAGPDGTLAVDLAAEGAPLCVTGGAGSGKTELLRSLAAGLAAGDRPDRLGLVVVDGGGTPGEGAGLRVCEELPHVSTYLAAGEPLRMRAFAQALTGELKRRAELLGDRDFAGVVGAPRRRGTAAAREGASAGRGRDRPVARDGQGAGDSRASAAALAGAGRPSERGRQRAGAAGGVPAEPAATGPGREAGDGRLSAATAADTGAPAAAAVPAAGEDGASAAGVAPLPRLVVLVDDFDTLVDPALGNPGRPAAGSMVRALEAVARDGARLGVHLVVASGRPERTVHTAAARLATAWVTLGEGVGPADRGVPGRGALRRAEREVTPFQAGLVTGRIPRTATQRPTVVPLPWTRAGDPPTRRPVRELGNGPTDLALLASALERAARSAGASPVPGLL